MKICFIYVCTSTSTICGGNGKTKWYRKFFSSRILNTQNKNIIFMSTSLHNFHVRENDCWSGTKAGKENILCEIKKALG